MKNQFMLLIFGFSLFTSAAATHTFSQEPATQDKKEGQTPNPNRTDADKMGPGKMGAVPMAQMDQVKTTGQPPSHNQMSHKKHKKNHPKPARTMPADKALETSH